MTRKTYRQLAAEAAAQIREIMPWELDTFRADNPNTLLLDIRERDEFEKVRIPGSLNIPRGILEPAAEWDYPETVAELVEARGRPIVVICRSGNRSALAALMLRTIGFENVVSMKLGVRGWNDSDLPLAGSSADHLDGDAAAELLEGELRPDQVDPVRR